MIREVDFPPDVHRHFPSHDEKGRPHDVQTEKSRNHGGNVESIFFFTKKCVNNECTKYDVLNCNIIL